MNVHLVLPEGAAIEKQRQHQKPVQVVIFVRQEQQYAISFLAQPEHRTPTLIKVQSVPVPLVELVNGVRLGQVYHWSVRLVSFVIQIVKMDMKLRVILVCT